MHWMLLHIDGNAKPLINVTFGNVAICGVAVTHNFKV